MKYETNIFCLSEDFYKHYPITKYPEILDKNERPYNYLLIETNAYYICIPFRSEMKHKNGFAFKKSLRSKAHHSGLDYSKSVILKDKTYFSDIPPIVDNDEYVETIENIGKIVDDITNYVNSYIKHKTGIKVLSQREYNRRYRYSALPYFDKELGIK